MSPSLPFLLQSLKTKMSGFLHQTLWPEHQDFFFHWNIVDLQYCVSFRCTVKWSRYTHTHTHTYLIAQLVKNPSAMQETPVGFLGQDHLLEKGISYPLQYSGLENSMDCIVPAVANSWTRLSDFTFTLRQSETVFFFFPFKNYARFYMQNMNLFICKMHK